MMLLFSFSALFFAFSIFETHFFCGKGKGVREVVVFMNMYLNT